MTSKNKGFTYKDYKFNIEIVFNSRLERRINGRRFHQVTINGIGNVAYLKQYEIEDEDDDCFFVQKVENIERLAKEYVDELEVPIISTLEKELETIGFK